LDGNAKHLFGETSKRAHRKIGKIKKVGGVGA